MLRIVREFMDVSVDRDTSLPKSCDAMRKWEVMGGQWTLVFGDQRYLLTRDPTEIQVIIEVRFTGVDDVRLIEELAPERALGFRGSVRAQVLKKQDLPFPGAPPFVKVGFVYLLPWEGLERFRRDVDLDQAALEAWLRRPAPKPAGEAAVLAAKA